MNKLNVLVAAATIVTILSAPTPALAMRDPGAGPMPASGMGLYSYGPAPVAASAMPQRPQPMAPPRVGQTGMNGQYQDGMNLYQYVGSNPGAYTDPSGTFMKYICCSKSQTISIRRDEALARRQIQALRGQINAAIAADTGQYPAFTTTALRTSLRYLDSASEVIRDYDVKCEQPNDSRLCNAGAIAWVKWIFTATVHLCPSKAGDFRFQYFELGPINRAATLVHEGTHVGGSLDLIYFPHTAERPHSVLLTGWQDIASTYDTWIVYGFCIPGHNCAALGPYVPNLGR